MIKKGLKMIASITGGLILFTAISGIVFVNFSPELGTKPNKKQTEDRAKTSHYKEGKFLNQEPTKTNFSLKDTWNFFKKKMANKAIVEPKNEIEVVKLSKNMFKNTPDSLQRITWLGHSTTLIEIDGKTIITDPMFSSSPSPIPGVVGKRFSKEMPITIEDLPEIDIVLISHDHYDHLDRKTIKELDRKTKKYIMPLGVDAHLIKWGINPNKIEVLDWSQSTLYANIKFSCTPGQHFSGRGLKSCNTLWCSWVIQAPSAKLFFSGDSGYGPHFKTIGKQYGPFDLALIECGQYDESFSQIHMMPEESVQAAIDIKTKLMLPIHWGSFALSLHDWNDPVIRAKKAASSLDLELTTPRIGESIYLNTAKFPKDIWWLN